jgi:hypothetical protein
MQFSAAGETLKKQYVWESLTDWKTWIASMVVRSLLMILTLKHFSASGNLYGFVRVALYLSDNFLVPNSCYPLLSDGPLYAFSLFTPSIIKQVSVDLYAPLAPCFTFTIAW